MPDISISEDLDALRDKVGGCRLVAYVDVSARMVLRVSADPKPRQEEIDALCDLAAHCLDGSKLPVFFDGEAPFSALVEVENETRHFIRSLADPADALILVTSKPTKQSKIWGAAQDLLEGQVAGDDAQ